MKKLLLYTLLWVTHYAHGATTHVIMNGTPITGSPFTTFNEAIDSLNTLSITASVFVMINSLQTDTLTKEAVITTTGTASNTVTITGTIPGIKPTIVSYMGTLPTSGSPNVTSDCMLVIAGGNYITIDGVNFIDQSGNNTGTKAMEVGIALTKQSSSNACQYVTITNCNITMNRCQVSYWTSTSPWLTVFSGSIGIAVVNTTHNSYTYLTPTGPSGTHRHNSFTNNTINQANTGILLLGYESADSTLTDANNIVSGNTITNFGGFSTNASDVSGVYAHGQNNLSLVVNTINNNNGSGNNHRGQTYGIVLRNCGLSTKLQNNSITLALGNPAGAVAPWGIYVSQSSTSVPSSSGINILSNQLSLNSIDYNLGGINGMIISPGTGIDTVMIDSNVFTPMTYGNNTVKSQGGIFGIYILGNPPLVYVRNNHIQGITRYDTSGYLATYPIAIYGGAIRYVSKNIIENINVYGIGSNNDLSCILNGGTVVALYCDSNIVRRIMMHKTSYSNTLSGIRTLNAAAPTVEHYRGNTVDSLISSGSGGVLGLYPELGTTAGTTRSITSNVISSLKGSGQTAGILIGRPVATISNNIIKNITNTSASGYVTGLYYFPGGVFQTLITKNMIYGLYPHVASTRVPSAIGMDIGAMPVDIFHNTVVLDSFGNNLSSTGTTFGVFGISLAGNSSHTRRIKNNIFNIKSTPRGTTGYSTVIQETGIANAYVKSTGLEISSNVLYSNNGRWNFYHTRGYRTSTFPLKNGYGTDSVTTDSINNVRADKYFNSSCGLFNRFISGTNYTENNLSIVSGIYAPIGASYAESQGASGTGITTDYLGNTYSNPPDIGAISFTGTSVPVATPNLSLATITQAGLIPQCIVSDWTYYGKSNDTNLYFAINKSGTLGITGDTVTINVDTNFWHTMSFGATLPSGSFLLKHGWDVKITNPSFTGYAKVKFPYSPVDTLYTRALRDTHYNRAVAASTLGITSVKNSKLEWFKTTNVPYTASWRLGILGNRFPPNHIKPPVSYGYQGVDYVELDSITSFSGGSAGYSFGPPNNLGGNALAVTWLSISGTATDTGNLVSWITASEENSKYFLIEYSFDGITFYSTGDTIIAAGKSAFERRYHILHKNFDFMVYYRVIQVGNDNEHDRDISKICVVKRHKKDELLQVSVYPNPVQNILHVSASTSSDIILYDVTGKVLVTQHNIVQTQIDVKDFTSGMYLLKVQSGEVSQVVKIQKN